MPGSRIKCKGLLLCAGFHGEVPCLGLSTDSKRFVPHVGWVVPDYSNVVRVLHFQKLTCQSESHPLHNY